MNFNNFTIKSQEAVQSAVNLVQAKGQQAIETPHLFKALLKEGEDVAQFLFGKLGGQPPGVGSAADSMIAGFPHVSGGEPYLSREANAVLQRATDLSAKAGDQFVSIEYILLALVAEKNMMQRPLNDAGITEKALPPPSPSCARAAKPPPLRPRTVTIRWKSTPSTSTNGRGRASSTPSSGATRRYAACCKS